jgi:hypothetical protein
MSSPDSCTIGGHSFFEIGVTQRSKTSSVVPLGTAVYFTPSVVVPDVSPSASIRVQRAGAKQRPVGEHALKQNAGRHVTPHASFHEPVKVCSAEPGANVIIDGVSVLVK